MPKRTANARWEGSLTEGSGTMRMASGAYEGPYSFQSRFEEGDGTNPEELIAAAHAGCFSMAFSGELEKAGFTPDSVRTTATASLEFIDGAATIARIDLDTTGRVPNIDADQFQKLAEVAKANCPVSRLYKGADIRVNAKLV
jgi:osmotically inducible protein OsmC